MNLVEELTGFVDNDFKQTFGTSVSIFDFKKVYITGYTRLGKIDKNEVVVEMRKNIITIFGKNLLVKLLQKKEIYVVGKIKSVVKDEKSSNM